MKKLFLFLLLSLFVITLSSQEKRDSVGKSSFRTVEVKKVKMKPTGGNVRVDGCFGKYDTIPAQTKNAVKCFKKDKAKK